MPGHLQSHPYIKSYDELQRTLKRQQQYLDIHGALLDTADKHKAERVVELVSKALEYIPKQYKLTKHDLKKLKEEN